MADTIGVPPGRQPYLDMIEGSGWTSPEPAIPASRIFVCTAIAWQEQWD